MPWTFYNSSGQQLKATADKAATQAEMEAVTSTAAYVTPGRAHYHLGVAKVWCRILADGTISGGTSLPNSYNIDTITDSGTGDRSVNYDTDFSSLHYSAVSSCSIDADNGSTPALLTYAVGSIRLLIKNSSGTAIDEIAGVGAWGDQ